MVKVPTNVTIDIETRKRLEEVAKKEKKTMSEIIEEALQEYFKKLESIRSMKGAFPQLKPLTQEEEKEIEGSI
ncbi:MAG: ribbon-helix-helix protein, CopG family [Thermoproteota archaeon]|nr:ribbon-helix-helix protein, CopG family [Thermoproteota archaeon]